jgi:hypothetical protein
MSATTDAMIDAEALKRALEDGTPVNIVSLHTCLRQLADAESIEDPTPSTTNSTTNFGEDEDSQLDSRYRTMEAAALRLQKEAKGYLDSLRGRLT